MEARGGREQARDHDSQEPNCGFYLREEHRLIRRHEESLTLNADNTARWKLRVDLELPDHPEACIEDGDEEFLYMFPLVYLRKNESRMQFTVFEEGRGSVPLPTRRECDDISSEAVSQAINFLAARIHPDFRFEEGDLRESAYKIPAAQAFEASMALQFFREELAIVTSDRKSPPAPLRTLGDTMVASGLDETLALLVEHALLWVPLRGRKNERRSIFLEQDIPLYRRSLVRWSFGSLTNPLKRRPWWNRRWARLARGDGGDGETLEIGGELYGRRDRRFSTSALGARIGQLLAWMPYEFSLPTIYAKRCGSYHFEVLCPPGRTPRDLKVSGEHLLEESGHPKPEPIPEARKAFTTRGARFDVPRGGLGEVATFVVRIGIGDGAFPLLWFLAGAVTTVMLWILAGADPGVGGEHARTTAGILLIVPALVAGLAASSNEVPIGQLIGGARLLLLTTGLSSVMAAAVFAGAEPFDLSPAVIWSFCATVATIATVPLATSWLLSSSLVWRQLMKLNIYRRQKQTLLTGIFVATLAIAVLGLIPGSTWLRVGCVGLLLLLMILLSALAGNRAAMSLGEKRHYLGSGFLLAGLTCLGLACLELRCVIYEHGLTSRSACLGPAGTLESLRIEGEVAALALLALSCFLGSLLDRIARCASPRRDEVHLAQRSGKALLDGESVRELPKLFERERKYEKRVVVDLVASPFSPPDIRSGSN